MDIFNFIKFNHLMVKFESDYNDLIEVRTEFGRPRIVVKGIPQSGGIVQDILKKALDVFNNPMRFLLLGLGGGGILHEARKRWPRCEITAVEIDPVMIEIAEKYFKIGQIERLRIVNEDAVVYINKKESEQKYKNTDFDAILVDCYVGNQVPVTLESEDFLRILKKCLSPNGRVVFNRIISPKESFLKTQAFIDKLYLIYDNVKSKRAYSNMIISCL